ncbi:sensor histidine kinase [Singulisphaera sp. PoT]|uniref:sensor histidine kinase n=1 Tax=Singulisphaera sp. PoT TaxID=3411797 RepID=UPI003BF568AC
MSLSHCMGHDYFWITLTVVLDLIVASGYALIALHWRRQEATLSQSPAKDALRNIKNIFVFCGICGYIFIPVKMFWPAWRLYDFTLAVLAYYTWRYALESRHLKVVYQQLGRTAQLVEDLEKSREDARRKSYFLNAISHDLKTPLNGMMLQIELASLSVDVQDPAMAEALSEIKSCAQTTANLLERFLEIGKLDWSEEPSVFEMIELPDLIHRVGHQARAKAELKGIGLHVECREPIIVKADCVKLERILFNLVDNAIKFTSEGSVTVSAQQNSRGISISVEDTGLGIAPEHQASIFDDFIQVNNRERDSRKGFGLGLGISRRLVEQIGGKLSLESEIGDGSRFTILFPNPVEPQRVVGGGAHRIEPFVAGQAAVAGR